MARSIEPHRARYVGDNEALVDEVRRRVLKAPTVRAWLYALADRHSAGWHNDGPPLDADLSDAAVATMEYWRALEILSHEVLEGLLLTNELHQIILCLTAPERPPGLFFVPPVPAHAIDRDGRRRRARAPQTIRLAARAYAARLAARPQDTGRLDEQLLTLVTGPTSLTDADVTAEAEVVVQEHARRGGRKAQEARQVVLAAHDWKTWGLLRPGRRRRAA